jgi:putative mRNA 3-end processing factor
LSTNIIADFIVLDKIGLYCKYGNFYLDPKEPVVNAVISHAHGDHAVSGNQNVYATKATWAFMQHRYKKFAAVSFYQVSYQQSFKLSDVEITFYPAGHILGSALVLMSYKGASYLYTGDYKLDADDTCEPIQFVKADVLITESTFANPTTLHPSAIEEIKKLSGVEPNIMLGAYALGKSQRLVSLISQHCENKTILVHHNVMPFMKIYEAFGINLGRYQVYDRKLMKNTKGGLIYLVPPMVYNSYFRAINVVRIFASGWGNLQQQNEVKLYISDHVDWDDILTAIKAVDPKEVWTLHGDGKHLKAHFEGKLEVKILN